MARSRCQSVCRRLIAIVPNFIGVVSASTPLYVDQISNCTRSMQPPRAGIQISEQVEGSYSALAARGDPPTVRSTKSETVAWPISSVIRLPFKNELFRIITCDKSLSDSRLR